MGVCASLAACLCFLVCLCLLCFEANKYDDDDDEFDLLRPIFLQEEYLARYLRYGDHTGQKTAKEASRECYKPNRK